MARSLCGQLQTDLRTLSNAATTANYRPVKEAAECGLLKLKTMVLGDFIIGFLNRHRDKKIKKNCKS